MPFRLARFRLKETELAAGGAAIDRFVDAVRAEPGTLRYDSFAHDDDPRSFVHFMEFVDDDAEARHRATEHVKAFVADLYPRCDEQPRFTGLKLRAAVGAHGLPLRNLHHVERFPAPPARVYRALMDAKEHAAFTNFSAEIDAKVGGRFVTCGGRNLGITLELVEPSLIVQSWTHKDWPDHIHSIARFALSAEDGGTRLDFTHVGVPAAAYHWLDDGWRETYWVALRKYLGG